MDGMQDVYNREEDELCRPAKECKGLVFKAQKSNWQTNRGVFSKVSLIEQKRLSCGGCRYCGPIREEYESEYLEFDCIEFDGIECGKYYRLECSDWDLMELRFTEINDI